MCLFVDSMYLWESEARRYYGCPGCELFNNGCPNPLNKIIRDVNSAIGQRAQAFGCSDRKPEPKYTKSWEIGAQIIWPKKLKQLLK